MVRVVALGRRTSCEGGWGGGALGMPRRGKGGSQGRRILAVYLRGGVPVVVVGVPFGGGDSNQTRVRD